MKIEGTQTRVERISVDVDPIAFIRQLIDNEIGADNDFTVDVDGTYWLSKYTVYGSHSGYETCPFITDTHKKLAWAEYVISLYAVIDMYKNRISEQEFYLY